MPVGMVGSRVVYKSYPCNLGDSPENSNMSYEIPTELQYQERIVFGLTMAQLAWALLFGIPILYIVMKTSVFLVLKIVVVAILTAIAVLFMFLDALGWVKRLVGWWRLREFKAGEPEMKKFLPVSFAKDCVFVQQNNGRTQKIAVLKVSPINFAIKNREAQNAIVTGFQRFLNSLDFPIQIVMGTDTLDLDAYLDALEKRAGKCYAERFEDYKAYLKQVVKERSVLNRIFYLIVPEQQRIGLGIQVEICKSQLAGMDIDAELLDSSQYPVVLAQFLCLPTARYPRSVVNKMDLVHMDDVYSCILHAHGYPRAVEAGFLDRLVTLPGDFDLSIHIEPHPIENTMVMLNRELQKQRADLYAAERRSILTPSLEIQHRDTLSILESLQKGQEKLFRVSLYLNAKASSEEELALLTSTLQAELNALLILPRKASFRMVQGVQSVLPLGMNSLKQQRTITTKPLSAFFPFTSRFLQVDEGGVWFGLSKTQVPLIRDIFSLTNPNGLILASSGAGKSFLAKLFIMRQLLTGTKVLVIDPQGEYSPLVEHFDGQLVTLSRTSETIINPLDLMGHSYAEKRLALMDLFPIMLGEMSEIQKAVLDRALTKVYEQKGISSDPKTWNRTPPILGDVLHELESSIKVVTVIEKPTYRSLSNRLSMYVTGVFSFLNTQTKLNFDNNFVCFNIGEMPRQVKPVLMFLILDFVYLKMKSDEGKKLLVVDEAWSLLGRTEDSTYVFEIVKTCRKFDLGLLLITQDVADLLRSDAGQAVLSNSAYTILLRQKAAVIEDVVRTFHLSGTEKDKLLTAQRGEGLLLMENEHTELQIVASDQEKELIDTKPEKKEENIPERETVNLNVNLNTPLYRMDELTEEEQEYLLKHGFTKHRFVGIDSQAPRDWLLKGSSRESPAHFFLVHLIADYLRTQTDKVELYETRDADIVFTARNGTKVALEIECGSQLKTAKKRFVEKVEALRGKYGRNWVFVVSRTNLRTSYKRYGKVLTRQTVRSYLDSFFA